MEKEINQNKKIFVALSGGVDSAVTTALLVEQGYDVTGVFMKNWSGDDFGIQSDCPWEKDQKDAESVCNQIGIPFMSFNFEKEYREKVVEYFFKEYKLGRTPNPDVICNKEIKFGIFLEKAKGMGAEMIATGHYARVRFNKGIHEYELLKGIDSNKDQSN
jgi:tRNA-specific 2-thiouridylase